MGIRFGDNCIGRARFDLSMNRATPLSIVQSGASGAVESDSVSNAAYTNCVISGGVVYFADEPVTILYDDLMKRFGVVVDSVISSSSGSCAVGLIDGSQKRAGSRKRKDTSSVMGKVRVSSIGR